MGAVRVSNRHLIEWMEGNGWEKRKASGVLWTYRYHSRSGKSIDVEVAAPHSNAKTDTRTLRDILKVSGVNRMAVLANSGLFTANAALDQAAADMGKFVGPYLVEGIEEDLKEDTPAAPEFEISEKPAEPEPSAELEEIPYRSRRISRPLRNALHAARLLRSNGEITFTSRRLLEVHPDPERTNEAALRQIFNHNPEFITVGRGKYQLSQKVGRAKTQQPEAPAEESVSPEDALALTLELIRERSEAGETTTPDHVAELLGWRRKRAANLLYRMTGSSGVVSLGSATYTLQEPTTEPVAAPDPEVHVPTEREEVAPVLPAPEVEVAASAPPPPKADAYELVDELLDLMLPDGFRAPHLQAVLKWREATLALIQEIRGGE